MAAYHDSGQAMEDDIMMTDFGDFGDFDPELFWLDAQNGLAHVGMSSQENMKCDLPGPDHPQQPPGPLSPWNILLSPTVECSSMTIERGPQTAHQLCGEVNTGHETGVAREGWQTGPIGLDDQQYVMLSPRSKVSTYMPGNGYGVTEGQGQVDRVNRNESRAMTRAMQNPAARSPRLLPPVCEGSQAGVIPSPHPGNAEGVDAAKQQQEEEQDWSYAFEVVPANLDDPNVLEHLVAINDTLVAKRVGDFRFEHTTSSSFGDLHHVRRYILPDRLRQDDRTRLIFMQVFNSNRSYNSKLPGYEFKMVQVFEPRQFHTPNEDYQAIAGLGDEDGVDGLPRFTDHDITDLAAYNPPVAPPFPSPEPHHDIDLAPIAAHSEQPTTLPTPKDETDVHPAQRSKPIPKPDRDVRKNAHGKYECAWPGCTEEPKSFSRKCEWNKHMDKHERPYKCLAQGCEKLSGFTYSGGLLRHEREVHAKHGGPRNPLNCPHVTCKRHAGKGFSRLENLNEHLRRVHTNPAAGASGDEAAEDGDSVDASESGQVPQQQIQFQPQQQLSPLLAPVIIPQKRALEDDETDLRSEVKRLRKSEEDLFRANSDLARQLEAQKQQAELDAANQKQELEAQKRQIMAMMAEMANMRQQLVQPEQQNDPSAILDDAFA